MILIRLKKPVNWDRVYLVGDSTIQEKLDNVVNPYVVQQEECKKRTNTKKLKTHIHPLYQQKVEVQETLSHQVFPSCQEVVGPTGSGDLSGMKLIGPAMEPSRSISDLSLKLLFLLFLRVTFSEIGRIQMKI